MKSKTSWIEFVQKALYVILKIMFFHRITVLQCLSCKLTLNVFRSDQSICSGTEGFIYGFNSCVAI